MSIQTKSPDKLGLSPSTRPPPAGLVSLCSLSLLPAVAHWPLPCAYSPRTLCHRAFAYAVPSPRHSFMFSLLSELRASPHLSSQQNSRPLPPRNVPASPGQFGSPWVRLPRPRVPPLDRIHVTRPDTGGDRVSSGVMKTFLS